MGNWIDDYNTGKEAYHKLDTVSESKFSLSGLRYILRHTITAYQMKKSRLEDEIKDINSKYQPKAAAPEIEKKRSAYKQDLTAAQSKLREQLNTILSAKREACRKYIMIPPSQDQLALLQSLQIRGVKSISDEEWNMIISSLAGNYQCSQILSKLAEDAGRKDFIPPVSSVGSLEQDLKLIEAYFTDAINSLDNPDNYRTMELIADRDTTPSAMLIEKLDKEIISTVPSSSLSTKNRLKDAAQHALHVGKYDLFHEIYDFIGANADKLSTQEEIEADFIAAAEDLIDKGNNAKEDKRTPYQAQLDKTIDVLEKATGDKGNE